MSQEVLTTVHASMSRRFIGAGVLFGLGALLLYLAFTTPARWYWVAFLLGLGMAILWLGQSLWRATQRHLELTETELRDSDGTVIIALSDVKSVSRGAFAIKPSNGFVITAKRPLSRSWRPGLWWRGGRRVGVGGVTPGSQSKMMADMIAAIVAQSEET